MCSIKFASVAALLTMMLLVLPEKLASQGLGLPGVRNYYKSDYMAGTQNWGIDQADNGYLYIANNKGLIVYDGSDFSVHSLPNGTVVRSLRVDHSGRIMVGGQQEFGAFETQNDGSLIYHSYVDLIEPKYRQFEDVWKILKVSDFTVFCTERALFITDSELNLYTVSNETLRFENFFVMGDELIVQTKNNALFRWSGGSELIPLECNNPPASRIIALLPYSGESHVIITESEGIFNFTPPVCEQLEHPINATILKHTAVCALQLHNGKMAIGTAKNGIVITDAEFNPEVNLNTASGLQNNTILHLFEDKRHNLWLSLDNGIDYLMLSSPITYVHEGFGIDGTGYAAHLFDERLYLGTNQGVYSAQWPPKRRDETRFIAHPDLSGQVWDLSEVNDGLFVTMHRGGFEVRDEQTAKVPDTDGVWKISPYLNHTNYLVLGSYSGLSILHRDEVTQEWSQGWPLNGFDESSRVFEIDNTGHIWVSHAYKGLFRIRLSDDLKKITQIKRYGFEEGLNEELLVNVCKIGGEIVFTSPGGIFRYNLLNDRIEHHPDFDGVFAPSANVHRLIEDDFGNIWFSVDDSFGVIKPRAKGQTSLNIHHFNQIQEALVDGFELIFALDAERNLIGQENGFVVIDHSKEFDAEFPFALIITGVRTISETDSLLHTAASVDTTRIPELDYDLNDLRFTYTVPYFEQFKPVRYRYKLHGFDREWSAWTDRTDKEYTNLPAGRYTFEVEAMNDFGGVAESASYSFRILPPLWASTPARVIYVILLIVLIFSFVVVISRREKRKTERFKEEQLHKVKEKEALFLKESKKTGQELMSLRNEKLKADINHKTSQLASATMHLVQKSEILMKLKRDLSKLSEDAPPELSKGLRRLIRAIESDIQFDNNWEQFEIYFDQVHENFFKRLRQQFPDLTPKDQKLCAYLRMNLSTKEIAPLLNISVRGVEISRYRVRKKLGIDSETNLVEYIMDI